MRACILMGHGHHLDGQLLGSSGQLRTVLKSAASCTRTLYCGAECAGDSPLIGKTVPAADNTVPLGQVAEQLSQDFCE